MGRAATRVGVGALLLAGAIGAGVAFLPDLLGRNAPDCRATMTATSGVPWSCDSIVNAPIPDDAAVDEEETALVRSTERVVLSIDAFTEPVHYASPDVAMRPVRCVLYACVGGSSAPLTGEEVVAPGSDGQLVVVDVEARRSYEFYQAERGADGRVRLGADGSLSAGTMNVVDLDGRGNETAEGRSLTVTGSGLSRMFGLVRAHEVVAAAYDPTTAIPHALQVSLPAELNCADRWQAPATKANGQGSDPCVEQGTRLRLDPGYDCATIAAPLGQAVCATLQEYGAFVLHSSTSRDVVLYAQQRDSWDAGLAHYAATGVVDDFSDLGVPTGLLEALAP